MLSPMNTPSTAPATESNARFGYKADGTPKKRPAGPGRPVGIYAPIRTKRIYAPEELAQSVVESISEGKGLRRSPHLGPVTEEDRRTLTRITGESVEVFNERIALSLRDIADLATQRIKEKLEGDEFKAGELGFILSVAHDKRLSLDGSRALNASSVNIQVNNYGGTPKESLLADLDGLSNSKTIDITPKETASHEATA